MSKLISIISIDETKSGPSFFFSERKSCPHIGHSTEARGTSALGRRNANGPPGLWGREIKNGPPGLWGRGLRSGAVGLWERELKNGPPGLWGRGLRNGPPGLWGREIEKVSKSSNRELSDVKSTEEDGNEAKEDIQEMK